MIRRTVSAFALAAALPLAAAAQSSSIDTIPDFELSGVTVTGARASVDAEEIPYRIDVISQAEIRKIPATNVAEVLRGALAIDMISYPGLLSGASIRGFRPQLSGLNPRTLILMDGRPAGTTNLALMDPASIERIEVLRGPASALYGSSAMGGVINVITRQSAGPVGGRIGGAYGEFGEYQGSVQLGGDIGAGFGFDASFATTGRNDSYEVGSHRTFGSDSLLKTLPDGTLTHLPRLSVDSAVSFVEYGSTSGSFRADYTGSGWWLRAGAEGFRADGVQGPGDLGVTSYDSRTLKDTERGSADLQLGTDQGIHDALVRLYLARESTDFYSAPSGSNYVSYSNPIDSWGVQVQDAISVGALGLTVGADYLSAATRSESFSAPDSRVAPFSPDASLRSAAAFGQGRLSVAEERIFLTAGARLDNVDFEILDTPFLQNYEANRERNLVFSPSAGISVEAIPGIRLMGNLGQAFVAPDPFFVAGYSESGAGVGRVSVAQGNPDLRAETSRTADIGASFTTAGRAIEADLTWFHTSVEDRISSIFQPGTGEVTASGDTITSTTTYVNAEEGTIQGIEGKASIDAGRALGWGRSARLFTNISHFLDASETIDGQSSRIRNIADLTAVVGVDYDDFERFSGRLAGRYVGTRYDSDYVSFFEPGEIEYPAYLVVDLSARVRFADRYSVGLDLRNLTDEDYFEVRGYNLPGRAFSIAAEVDF